MTATSYSPTIRVEDSIKVTSRDFHQNKFAYYEQMTRQAPVWKSKLAMMNIYLIPRYEDCMTFFKDPRFVRNRATATGGGRLPFPVPKSILFLMESMIITDGDDHRRLRSLVNKGFTPKATEKFAARIEGLTHELLDVAEKKGQVDLLPEYCLPIPATVISEMVGISKAQMPMFTDSLRVLTKGLSGWTLLRTMFWDLRKVAGFFETIIAEKRANPKDDILTRLIEAEEEGDRLTPHELIATVFLLVIAGYETTTHLIANGIIALLENPEQMERLRADPKLIDGAVEEMLRHRGPVQATKPSYALEDLELHGVRIKKGAAVMPLLGAANHDPAVFDKPDQFEIERTPNRHLAFGFGEHVCLGSQLARLETKIAIRTLLDRNPNLRLAIPSADLKIQNMPLWHRHESLPVSFG